MERRLYRSRRNRVFLGVCGGLGEFFNIDPVIIRVIAVVITVFTGVFPGLLAYFIIALIVPLEGSTAATPEQSFQENVADIKKSSINLGQGIRSTFENQPPTKNNADSSTVTGLIILGTVLIALGAIFIVEQVFHWSLWTFTFPTLLVLAGFVIILVVLARRR
jgi:phage shock protein C